MGAKNGNLVSTPAQLLDVTCDGDVTNDLIPLSGEPNVSIHESKALCCAVFPGRRPPDAEMGPWLEKLARSARPKEPPA